MSGTGGKRQHRRYKPHINPALHRRVVVQPTESAGITQAGLNVQSAANSAVRKQYEHHVLRSVKLWTA
jgi:hypothetical protein